jgi:hypothetical protein
LTAYPSANGQLVSMRNSTNSLFWWLDITPTGFLRLRNLAGTSVATSIRPVPLNKPLRIEITADGADIKAYLFGGNSLGPVEALASTNFDTSISAQQIRFGNTSTAPTWPKIFFDEIVFTNTAVRIGPVTTPSTLSGWTRWNGTSEVPLTLDGAWDGSLIKPFGSQDRF